jgi:hypothetical protein
MSSGQSRIGESGSLRSRTFGMRSTYQEQVLAEAGDRDLSPSGDLVAHLLSVSC